MIQRRPFAVVYKFRIASKVSAHLRILFFVLLIATSGVFLAVDARAQGKTEPGNAKQTIKKKHRLRITKGYITAMSLKADKAKMSDVAADLAKRLGTQVILGTTMQKNSITVEFYDLPLETALGLLASHVYIDYEIRANAQPTPLAIYLMDREDPEPAKTAVVQGSSEAMMFEGNTEDTGEHSEAQTAEDPLQVELEDNQLTIKSKKQPLIAVMMSIAEVLGVPAEIKYESDEIVDTVIKDTPFEEAVARLSPNIRLYVRADLTRSQRRPLRIRLVHPAKVDSAMNQ